MQQANLNGQVVMAEPEPDMAEIVGKWSDADLVACQKEITESVRELQDRFKVIAGEVHRRHGGAAEAALRAVDKWESGGGTTVDLGNGLKLKASRSRSVSYDSDGLMEIAAGMPWDRVQATFKIKFSVGETIYKGLKAADPDMAKRVEDARTVKIGDLALALVQEG